MSDLVTLLRCAVAAAVDDPETTCATLSGGLDSSTVVALAPYAINTFTGYYAGGRAWDEREYAWLAARGNHVEVEITPDDFVAEFDGYARAVAPLADPMGVGGFGQYVVAREIARHGFRTVLSGEGSDELFGGYARQLRLVEPDRVPPEYRDYVPPAGYPTDHAAALDWDYARLADLLAVDDAILAAHGLVGKAPFTDPRVVAHGLALPPSDRIWKRHLRAAVRGIVADEIVDRTDKMGFPSPVVFWARTPRNPVHDFVRDRLGYVPGPDVAPHDRGWWHELIRASA